MDGRCMWFAAIGAQDYDYEHSLPVYEPPWVDEQLSATQEVAGVGDTTRKCGGVDCQVLIQVATLGEEGPWCIACGTVSPLPYMCPTG